MAEQLVAVYLDRAYGAERANLQLTIELHTARTEAKEAKDAAAAEKIAQDDNFAQVERDRAGLTFDLIRRNADLAVEKAELRIKLDSVEAEKDELEEDKDVLEEQLARYLVEKGPIGGMRPRRVFWGGSDWDDDTTHAEAQSDLDSSPRLQGNGEVVIAVPSTGVVGSRKPDGRYAPLVMSGEWQARFTELFSRARPRTEDLVGVEYVVAEATPLAAWEEGRSDEGWQG
ncbi:hypothetical protein LTR17_015721 [Elasticomyces elasticus]|nr:hypothetical protein LTR17_015721 [Elasticomyces elasticus]